MACGSPRIESGFGRWAVRLATPHETKPSCLSKPIGINYQMIKAMKNIVTECAIEHTNTINGNGLNHIEAGT